jgi:type VI secretion system protein ImpF
LSDLTLKERLQPSLLDRLTDRDPGNQQESRDRRVISESRLRASVIRDLEWLLNTASLDSTYDLEAFPAVRASTLNYGIPDLAGVVASSIEPAELEQSIRRAILRFEPRLMADSVRVSLTADQGSFDHNVLMLRIEANLWAEPLPVSLYLRTELDLEQGQFKLAESGR